MLLSDFSIKRPVSTVVIIIALMCLGLLALGPGAWSIDARLYGRKRIEV